MSRTIENKARAALPFNVLLFLVCIMVSSSFIIIINQQPIYAASLTSQAAIPSNNIVTTTSTYEIMFTTATAGTIKTIEIAFPSGYNLAGVKVIERVGIGSGTITANQFNTLVYTVTSPVNVVTGTPIRLELANIVNKITIDSTVLTITTKNTNGGIIDGPTAAAVPLKQIATTDIANSAVTNLKLGANAVTGQKILDGNVGTNDLADNAITSQKIGTGQVSASDIADGSITSQKLADNTILNSATQVRGSVTHVPSQSLRTSSAECPVGQIAVSGGFTLPDVAAPDPVRLSLEYPSFYNGLSRWTVEAYNPSTESQPFMPTAMCIPERLP